MHNMVCHTLYRIYIKKKIVFSPDLLKSMNILVLNDFQLDEIWFPFLLF